jgi:putative ABC transport system ATP-binding protein
MTIPSTAEVSAPTSPAAVRAIDLVKVYGTGDMTVTALDGVTIDFPAGRFTAIMGPSGSGKSTLMHCLAGLDTITSGQVLLGEIDIASLNDKKLTALRRDRVGFVFQQFNLLPTLTARENITLPLDIAGTKVDKAWFDQVVDAVGLRDRLRHRPSEQPRQRGQRRSAGLPAALGARVRSDGGDGDPRPAVRRVRGPRRLPRRRADRRRDGRSDGRPRAGPDEGPRTLRRPLMLRTI